MLDGARGGMMPVKQCDDDDPKGHNDHQQENDVLVESTVGLVVASGDEQQEYNEQQQQQEPVHTIHNNIALNTSMEIETGGSGGTTTVSHHHSRKGEVQPRAFRDWLFAILFLVQALAIITTAAMFTFLGWKTVSTPTLVTWAAYLVPSFSVVVVFIVMTCCPIKFVQVSFFVAPIVFGIMALTPTLMFTTTAAATTIFWIAAAVMIAMSCLVSRPGVRVLCGDSPQDCDDGRVRPRRQ